MEYDKIPTVFSRREYNLSIDFCISRFPSSERNGLFESVICRFFEKQNFQRPCPHFASVVQISIVPTRPSSKIKPIFPNYARFLQVADLTVFEVEVKKTPFEVFALSAKYPTWRSFLAVNYDYLIF